MLSSTERYSHRVLAQRGQARRCIKRVAFAGIASIVAVATFAVTLQAHDFWLIPDPFAVASGGTITVRGQSGIRFPESESAIPANRIVDARLIGARGELRIGDLATEGKALRLRQRPSGDGQYLVAVSLEPRSTRTTPAGFSRYLKLEGAADEAPRLERDGAFAVSDSTFRASKFAKTIVELGRGGERAFGKSAGQSLEFIPTTDPARAKVGDTIALRVIANNQPVAGLCVNAGAAADSMLRGKGSTQDPDLHLLTDASGIVRVALRRPGLWNVRASRVVSPDSERARSAGAPPEGGGSQEWQINWATFVFGVQPVASTRSDSADAVNTVLSFHAALAASDTAGVLALLAPDGVVLENGDLETREQYRAQHLDADVAFARTVRASRTPVRVVTRGDVAWVASTTTNQGTFRGHPIDSAGAELMVLTRVPNVWQIRSIHWSSHARRTR